MDEARAARLYQEANAERWTLPRAVFTEALDRSMAKAFAGRGPSPAQRDRYLASLHLADLALACACARGHEGAWDHFVAEFRPALYRAADAVAPNGAAREVADALHAELFGLKERDGERQSLFHYFHGRSSLATWLRSLVAQRYVDRIREVKRHDPFPDEASPAPMAAPTAAPNPDQPRFAAAMRAALGAVLLVLTPRDRLRLGCYYAQAMTLAQIGRVTGEHEATVSRQLTRTRRDIRHAVERHLREQHRFGDREIEECFASVSADTGAIDLGDWLAPAEPGKKSTGDRSNLEEPS